jgi:signal transduction histidine kinase
LRAKQSSTAIGMCSYAGALSAQPDRPGQRTDVSLDGYSGDGLLHDARNLISAIGLYCDLLSMPGVLKPEHRKYPEELRHLGMRSQEMIEHLMHSLAGQRSDAARDGHLLPQSSEQGGDDIKRNAERRRTFQFNNRAQPVSLRSVVERRSGLLSRVANGRAIEVTYGPTADVPIRVAEESVERILVNLVRNGSAAMGGEYAALRIAVGPLDGAVGDAQVWPLQCVRLVVEDSGCGMNSRQLEALLSGSGPVPRGNHGIGFRVVRELVAASNGELRVASARGIGTRIQVEWPMAEMASIGTGNTGIMSGRVTNRNAENQLGDDIVRATGNLGFRNKALTEESHGAC